MSEITGGSPYGAGTLAGSDGRRRLSENELKIARFQGRHVAGITKETMHIDFVLVETQPIGTQSAKNIAP